MKTPRSASLPTGRGPEPAMDGPLERSVLAARLATLRGEYSSGQQVLAELELRAAALREQLLRIQGAAQVLEELLGATPGRARPVHAPGEPP